MSEESQSGDGDRWTDGGGEAASPTDPAPATSKAELTRQLEAARSERDEAQANVERLESELADERARYQALCADVEDLTTVVTANAGGDLTETPGRPDSESIEPLYDAYEDLLVEWRDTVDRMSSFSEQVSSATTQVDDRIDSVKTASREVSDAVDGISEGSERQNENIQDISDEMRSLSATIQEIAASADEAAQTSSQAAERGTAAQDSATDAMSELDQLTDHAQETLEKVEELDDLMADIEDIVGFITDVADQTNILALNANIEAARAGEAGDGFTVVASEVKTLASETKEATEEIKTSIDRVHDQVETTVDEMHQTRDSVDRTHGTVETAIEELDTVVDKVSEVDASVQEIDEATDSQARSTQEVVSMVDEVGEISDRTAEEAATAAEAAGNQTTQLTEVSSKVSTLTDRANTLEASLEDFEIGKGSVSTRSDDTVVEFWHAMGGEKAMLLEDLAREFEDQSDGISLSLSSKGDYRGTFDAAIRAAEQGDPPAITQIFEIGTTRARESSSFRPVDELLSRDHIESLLDPVLNYYRFDGTLYSVPFNSSNPVLVYNKDAFEAAGLDPTSPPATFDAVTDASEQLVREGPTDYGITFANYSWFVEQWFAEANETLVDNDNGRSGPPTTSNINGEFGHSLFEWWADIETKGLYDNPGIEARGAAKEAFDNEEAAILIGSTSSLGGIEASTDFPIGTGEFPVLDDRTGVLVGGASLWVGDDLPADVHESVGEFLTWLTEPEQQKRWHRETGYFPVHEDAIVQLRFEDWFEKNPHYETAFKQLLETSDTVATRGAQVGPFDTVRTVIEEGYERIDTVDDVPDVLDDVDRKIESALRSADG